MTGSTWEFGGFAPVFNGPDFSPRSVLVTDTWTQQVGSLFTLDFGTATYTHQSPSLVGTGITFHSATGSYTGAGSVTEGTYAMVFRCTGSDGSYTEYSWSLIANAATNKPLFTGPIDNQQAAGNATFDAGAYFTGASSYSATPTVTGISFNTATGVFTITAATAGTGIFGPFTVTATNGAGSTSSNPFSYTVLIADTPGDFTDTTLQALLDPQGNFTGIRIIRKHVPANPNVISYYVIPLQNNPGRSKWVEVLATDDAAARANKIVQGTTIAAQPTWPLP